MRPGYQEQILYILNKHHSIVTVELGDAVTDDILQLIDSAKREELERLHETLLMNEDNPDPVKLIEHRIAQLEQSEESEL